MRNRYLVEQCYFNKHFQKETKIMAILKFVSEMTRNIFLSHTDLLIYLNKSK